MRGTTLVATQRRRTTAHQLRVDSSQKHRLRGSPSSRLRAPRITGRSIQVVSLGFIIGFEKLCFPHGN